MAMTQNGFRQNMGKSLYLINHVYYFFYVKLSNQNINIDNNVARILFRPMIQKSIRVSTFGKTLIKEYQKH